MKKKIPVLLLLISLFGGFLLVELFFVAVLPQPSFYIYEYKDEGYLWNNGESGFYASSFDRLPMEINYNQVGDRDLRDHEIEKAEDAYRVLFLGDSVSFGWPLEEGYIDSFKDSLQQEIGTDKQVETINCSTIAANVLDLYKLYEKRCAHYEDIDLVVLQSTIDKLPIMFAIMFGENKGRDFTEIKILFEYYSKQKEKEVLLAEFVSRIRLDDFGVPQLTLKKSEIEIIKRHFKPTLWGYDRFNFVRFIENNILTKYTLFLRQDMAEAFLKKYDFISKDVFMPQVEVAVKLLPQWKKELKDQNIDFLLINIPNARGIDIALNPEERTHKKLQETYNLFLKKLENLEINYIDYLSLMGKDSKAQNFYIDIDIHPNQNGYDLIGSYLAGYIYKTFYE